jgi:ACS family tartrate transporter-like MFS transporter
MQCALRCGGDRITLDPQTTMSSGIAVAVPATGADAQDDSELARATMRRVSMRLLPFLFTLYIVNYLDRSNVALAALTMNRDLKFSATVYGLGASVFFVGYCLFDIPSNLILARVGARRWIGRIMISWGVIATAMMFVRTPLQFYGLRFVLGAAEAGFLPGIMYYLGGWFPAAHRARAVARFMVAVPLSFAVGGAIGGVLLGLNGAVGLRGWQWLFLIEGIPAVILGIVVLGYLPDRVDDARWLTNAQRAWLTQKLLRENSGEHGTWWQDLVRAITNPVLFLVAFVWFCVLTSGYVYFFWAPIVIRDALHATNLVTGLIISAVGVLAAAGMLIGGARSDRTNERFLQPALSAVLIATGYVGAAVLPRPWGPVVGLAIASIAQCSVFGPFWCIPPMVLSGTAAAAGIAIVSVFGNIGGILGPSIAGRLKDTTGGMTITFLGVAALALCAAGILLVLHKLGLSRTSAARS